MSDKRITYLYYFCIALTGIFFIISGFYEITKNPATYPKTLRMGYPPYFITTLGYAKIVGALALWLPNFKKLKEWVFAGFTFDIVFAFISGLNIHSVTDCTKAAVAFVLILLVYGLFSGRNQTGNTSRPVKVTESTGLRTG